MSKKKKQNKTKQKVLHHSYHILNLSHWFFRLIIMLS